jgi:hypothetical protein
MGVLPQRNMPCNRPVAMPDVSVPETLVRKYRLEAVTEDGANVVIADVDENTRRLVRHKIGMSVRALKLVPVDTWGAENVHIFSFDFA